MFTEQDAKKIEDKGRNLLAVVFGLPSDRVRIATHVSGWRIHVFAEADLGQSRNLTWNALDRLRAGLVSVFGTVDPPMTLETSNGTRGVHATLKIEVDVEAPKKEG